MNQCFVFHVQTGSGLIQQNDGGVLQKCPRNGNALPLASGKGTAVFANDGVPFVGKPLCELVTVGKPCGSQHLLVCSVLASQADVFQNGVVEQGHILEHDGIQAHELFRLNLRNIHAAHGDASLLIVPEAGGQPGNSGLAATGGANQGSDLSLFGSEGHIPQHRFAGIVGKSHMVEYDVAALVGELLAAGLDGIVQNFVHPRHIGAHGNNRR